MSDLLSPDDLPSGIPGQLQQISAVTSSFAEIANTARQSAGQLNDASNSLHWTGAAADQFRHVLGDLPRYLTDVGASYQTASDALRNYLNALGPLQSQFTALRRAIYQVVDDAMNTQRQRDSAQASGQDTSYYDQQLQSLVDEINQQLLRLQSLWYEASGAATSMVNGFNSARSQGDMNTGWGGIERVAGDVGGVIGGVATGLWNTIQDLGKSLAKLWDDIEHGRWDAVLKDLHQVMKDINSILSTIAILVQWIPVVGEVIDATLLVTATAMVAIDIFTGDKGNLLGDALSGLPMSGATKATELVGKEGKDLLDGAGRDGMAELLGSVADAPAAMTRSAAQGVIKDAKALIGAPGTIKAAQNRLKAAILSGDVAKQVQAEATIARFQDRVTTLSQRLGDLGSSQRIHQIISLPDKVTFTGLSNLRKTYQQMRLKSTLVRTVNPTVYNKFGLQVSYRQLDAAIHGARTGISISNVTQDSSPSSDKSVATNLLKDVTSPLLMQ